MKKLISMIMSLIFCLCIALPASALGSESQEVIPQLISIKDCEINYKPIAVYTGKEITPNVTVSFENERLKEGRDYTLEYNNNKDYGKATITLTGIGSFNGVKNCSFKIAPKRTQIKSLISDFTMRFKIAWKQNKKADGYRIEYSLNRDMSDFKYKTITKNTTNKKTIRGLVAGAKYYVRIRTFKNTESGRAYSDYSKIKTVKIKKPKYKTSKKNIICLTFDDGPSFVTEDVLNTLKANNIKATFFIVNYKKEHKPLIQRMIDDGHTLAIHNYSHDYAKIYKSTSAFMKYFNKLNKKIKKDFDYDIKFMRFPGGTSNTVSRNYSKGIMKKLSKMITKKGYTYFDWNVSSGDASGNNVKKSKIVKETTSTLKKNRTNIVLMHDSGAKQTTADALQSIINYANNNGYVFEAITEKTQKVQHNPQN